MVVEEALYLPVAFSDHFAHMLTFSVPEDLSTILCPKSRPTFRLQAEVIKDKVFNERLKKAMQMWGTVLNYQGEGEDGQKVGILNWWENLVKPGIRKIGLERTKEMYIERKEWLNLLLIRQAYLTKKLQIGLVQKLGELKEVHLLIDMWYKKESEKVQHQSRVAEFCTNEKTTIYHHELHKRVMKKGAILRLQTEAGMLEGHKACMEYLEGTVEDLLLHQGNLNHVAQQVLLNEVEPVFTEQDNQLFLTPPTKDDDRKTVNNSNLLAAPGTDGIPGLVYKECWNVLGDHLTAVMNNIFKCKELPMSMRTSLMVFGSKPKKPGSLLPKDKRRISLLNSDFKVATGLETRKFKATASHTLSHLQLVAGDDRRI